MARNVRRLASRLAARGVALRLHAKTCKSADAVAACRAALADEKGAGRPRFSGIAVSTLAEAEYFAAHGIPDASDDAGDADMLYAVGMAPAKLERALALVRDGARLALLADGADAARALADFGRAHGAAFAVFLEIDCDGHRGGLAPASPELMEAAALLADAGQRVAGVLTHAGSAYELPAPSPAAFAALAEQERAAAVEAAARLRAAGHACPAVSVGSTPTALFGEDLSGVTEVRAGVFPFHDLVMAGLGVCAAGDIAISVLCTVIGRRRSDGALITDAGWTALSRDAGEADGLGRHGYGLVCDCAGHILPGLRVTETNQEHGIISTGNGAPAPELPVGTLLRVLPVHACATAACFDAWHVPGMDGSVARWARCRGW